MKDKSYCLKSWIWNLETITNITSQMHISFLTDYMPSSDESRTR